MAEYAECISLEGQFENRLLDNVSKWIGQMAENALLEEVYTTPKPGLVDCYSNGSHRDMNVFTFESSARAIGPYFVQMAEAGWEMAYELERCFHKIRTIGKQAEMAMYAATNQVNTHKGLIFSLGILCAATGACFRKYKCVTWKELIQAEQKMVRNTLVEELNQIRDNKEVKSNGERLYQSLGTTGVRGEAISGFSSIKHISLPVMQEGIQKGYDYNLVKLQTLMVLMSRVEDSNVLARTNQNTLEEVQHVAKNFISRGGAYQKNAIAILKEMDAEFIQKNISSGGCADLLAITIYLKSVLTR